MPHVKKTSGTLIVLVCWSATLAMAAQDTENLKDRSATGEAVAQYDLALRYDNGIDIAQDSVQAALWYRRAAEANVVQAQYRIGYDYFMGRGVPQNYAQSVKWWRKASSQGYAPAAVGLGLSYYSGTGVSASKMKSYFWCDIAASGNLGGVRMKNVVDFRDSVGSQLSSDVLSQTQDLVQKWAEAAPPRADPFEAQEEAVPEPQAKPSTTPYADQFLAQMQARDAANPNSAYSKRLALLQQEQEMLNKLVPKFAHELLNDPTESPEIR